MIPASRARLYAIADYNIFDEKERDDYKSTFGIYGTFQGIYFDLYDHKRDDRINVNYCDKMDYKLFEKSLLELMKNATPKEYTALPCWGFKRGNDKKIYEWKNN